MQSKIKTNQASFDDINLKLKDIYLKCETNKEKLQKIKKELKEIQDFIKKGRKNMKTY